MGINTLLSMLNGRIMTPDDHRLNKEAIKCKWMIYTSVVIFLFGVFKERVTTRNSLASKTTCYKQTKVDLTLGLQV